MKAVLYLRQKLTDADGDILDFQRDVAHWKKARGD